MRQAVAYALDRNTVVKSLYLGRGIVADEFQPSTLKYGYSTSVPKYRFNPAKAKALLQAGGPDAAGRGRVLVPVGRLPSVHAGSEAELPGVLREPREESGSRSSPKTAPWRPDYLGRASAGTAGALNFLGWTGDFGDPESFLGSILRANTQFGLDNAVGKKLYADLDKALAETNVDEAGGHVPVGSTTTS